MTNNEKQRINSMANWYIDEQLDFDKKLIHYRYLTLKQKVSGKRCLELGCADGQMTKYLVQDFEQLTSVDCAQDLLHLIPEHDNLVKVCSLFEEFTPDGLYDVIILEHILEHVEDPIDIMSRLKKWLAPNGKIYLGVPNGNSIHRLVAVKMGLLEHPCQLNCRDLAQGHRRVYTQETFCSDIKASGLSIEEVGGVFFKPVSNQQIQDTWDDKMMDGFFQLGSDFQEYAADIFVVCSA